MQYETLSVTVVGQVASVRPTATEPVVSFQIRSLLSG